MIFTLIQWKSWRSQANKGGNLNVAKKVIIKSIIGVDSKFEGVINTDETTRIDGEFTGTIKATGMVIVGETGKIFGDIFAKDVVVAGEIKGNIQAKGKTDVAATGRIFGDLSTRSLTIDENAVFQGQCAMNVQSDEYDDIEMIS